MKDVYKKLEQAFAELYYVPPSTHTVHIGSLICQVREMLEALEAKQKTWEAKEVSQEDQPEQDHSTQHNDPKLPEKEQLQRTRKANKKQYILSYPDGYQRDSHGNMITHAEIAVQLLDELEAGRNIYILDNWKVQVVDL